MQSPFADAALAYNFGPNTPHYDIKIIFGERVYYVHKQVCFQSAVLKSRINDTVNVVNDRLQITNCKDLGVESVASTFFKILYYSKSLCPYGYEEPWLSISLSEIEKESQNVFYWKMSELAERVIKKIFDMPDRKDRTVMMLTMDENVKLLSKVIAFLGMTEICV